MSKQIESVTHENGKRFYRSPKTGNDYPSVTTILSKFEDRSYLKKWREGFGDNDTAKQLSNHFASQGTRVHSCIEHYLKDGRTFDFSKYEADKKIPDELVDEIKLRSFAFEPFLQNINLVQSEEKIIWERPAPYGGWFGFGGTPDLIGHANTFDWLTDIGSKEKLSDEGGFFIADFKNWRKRKSEADCIKPALQLAAYAAAKNSELSVENSIRHGFVLGSSVSEVKKIPALQIFYLDLEKLDFYWSVFFEFVKKYHGLDSTVTWSNFKAKAVGYYLDGKDEETGKNIWAKTETNFLPQKLQIGLDTPPQE